MAAGTVDIPAHLLFDYKKIGLTDDELVFILFIKYALDHGDKFPDLKAISHYMGRDLEEIYQLIQNLLENKNLTIQTVKNSEGKDTDLFSLELLWEKLFMLQTHQKEHQEQDDRVQLQKKLYKMFEDEFGRPLSPIEMQTLSMWLYEDHYTPDIIALALKEAVLAQAYSFKYMDRILLNWRKKNITTKEQVEAESRKFRQSKVESYATDEATGYYDPVPLFNWIKPGEDASDERTTSK